MKSLRWFFAGLFLLMFAAAAYPQVGGGFVSGGGDTIFGVSTLAGGGLKGVPFSADIVNESSRVLADGTRIHRETQGKTFRDSEGRTRNERENEFSDGPKRVMVTIFDPSQQVMIMLDPQTKTATVNHFKRMLDATPAPVDHGVVVGSRTAPRVTSHPSMKREDLGTKEIEGFTVTGSRITRTMEAGSIGNDRPITSLHETWSSPDLKVVLLMTWDDPQSGQRTMRLTNIRTGEPDPLLFQVPADYTVKEN